MAPSRFRATSSSASSVASAAEPFTLEERSLRKVLKKLSEAGFAVYRTGGHHILKLANGGASVAVPIHGAELKEGTLKSIERQARAALQGK